VATLGGALMHFGGRKVMNSKTEPTNAAADA
jgi:hypothetical protein